MRILTYVVTAQDAGRAVRSVVPRRFSLGTHAYRHLKAAGGIFLDGEPVRADAMVSIGQTLEIRLDNGYASISPNDAPAPAFDVPSFIRYQDEDMLIVCKGAPLATLPSAAIRTGTLREQLCTLLGESPETFHYHPVNRLDKGTSGLLCVARHAHAQRLLSAQLHTGSFVREYLAVTQGIPEERVGTLNAPIARLGAGARRGVRADGQHAVTHYRVEATAQGRALLRLRLETGRTHQIRVHLSSIGCPVVGDYLYGQALPALGGRFALHSAHLSCIKPLTGERITLDEPLPDVLQALLDS